MNLKIENVYNGFKLIDKKYIKEIDGESLTFNHEKTGARLIKIVKDDDNKVFSIGFRTPPKDSTGVAHILEHSVLCGSRKFDMKEPFVELLKGSLNTFLNAMTYPDKTIYPVASRNKKDFFNLMDVYLDAVLYPNIYKYKEIFMQEGWHYNLENIEDEITYNGVVYNEMKGAYSSPDSMLYRKIPGSLYPNTTYVESSGGDPEKIPDLTYEDFLNFHKKYYHPSNAFMYLYGNGNLEEELAFINDNYLKDFNKDNVNSEINVEVPFDKMEEKEIFYPIGEEEEVENKSFYSLNFSVGKAGNSELYLAFEVLTHLLLRSTAAPLKKILLDKEICKSVTGDFDNGIKQPYFSIIAKNAAENKKEEFKKVVFESLEKMVKEGIDKELIEASINRVEFELREEDYGSYPKGLIYYLKIMDSWLYEENPLINLDYEKDLEKIKTALTTNYFEKLIEKYILKNSHSSLVSLHPKKGLNQENVKALEDKLKNYKASLTEEELDNIIKECKILKERQSKEDTKEALESIPVLSLEDIEEKPEKLPLEEKELDDVKVLHHNFHSNKISYLNLYFNSKVATEEEIPLLTLLSDILGKAGVKDYSYEKLANRVNINSGGISYFPYSISNLRELNGYNTYFEVSLKCLRDKLDVVFDILKDVLLTTDFSDEKRIKQIVSEKRSRIEASIFDNGHRIASKKILSYISEKGIYDEKLTGLDYYNFIRDLDENFNIEDLKVKLEALSKKLFNKNNLIISFSGTDEDYSYLEKSAKGFINALNNEKVQLNDYKFDLEVKNEALMVQGNVQYVAKGGNYGNGHLDYHGALNILETILGFDYLWNNVRVKGGAYGVMSNFRRDGSVSFVSYRDPNIKETLDVFDGMVEYLDDFNVSEREMQKYIIGTVRKLDTPIGNSVKGELATSLYFSGLTYADRVKERKEILSANQEVIKSFGKIVKSALSENAICVLGNEDKLKENKELFNELIKVIK
ncbi:MAG: insulinase family protein [Sarcina sp.]